MATQFQEWQRVFEELSRAAQSGDALLADRTRSEKAMPVFKAIEEAVARLVISGRGCLLSCC